MSNAHAVVFEGFTPDELLALPQEELTALILTDQPLVFRIGSAEILGQFRVQSNRLVVELAKIEGGGEGVLLPLSLVAERYARVCGLEAVEWIVHAIHCGTPNLKLRRVLLRRGCVVRHVPGAGEAYYLLQSLERDGLLE